MDLLVSGGTGFIGQHLIPSLLDEGAKITVVGRDTKKIQQYFSTKVEAVDWNHLDQLDPNHFTAVINLSGENISAHRWSESLKNRIRDSRLQATKSILQWCTKRNKPLTLYNASAISIYAVDPPSMKPFSEDATIDWGHPALFLSEVAQMWEELGRNQDPNLVHIVYLRFAPVLSRHGGVLKKLMPIFKCGLGGPVGTGKQPFCWIHLDDAVRAIQFLLKNPKMRGPVNITAPTWVDQGQFASTLGKVLHRPAFIPTPSWLLTAIFGQMAEELLLTGQVAYPKVLLENQFTFLYATLEAALEKEIHTSSKLENR